MLPYNPVEGFVAGAVSGAAVGTEPVFYPIDPITLYIVAAVASVGAIAGVATAKMPSTIDKFEEALKDVDPGKLIGEMLVRAIIKTGNDMRTLKFVPARKGDRPPAPERNQTTGAVSTPASGRVIELIIKPTAVGITQHGVAESVLIKVKGRLGPQVIEPIEYWSDAHELEYWTADDGANIKEVLRIGVDSLAGDLLRAVFEGTTSR